MRNGHSSFLQPADSSRGNDWLGAECREAQVLSCAAYFGARVFLYVFCTGCFPPFCRCRCRCFYEAFLAPGWIREKTKWIEREREREREREKGRGRAKEKKKNRGSVREYSWSLCAERQTLLLLAFALPLRLLPALRLLHALFATHPSPSQERRKRGRRGKEKGREEKQLRRVSSKIPSPSVANYTRESFCRGMTAE